jgi:hypothetical protein
VASPPALTIERLDREFLELAVYAQTSWSNLRINSRLSTIRALVRPDHSLASKFQLVHSAVDEADDIGYIIDLIKELHRAVRESVIARGVT